MTTHRYIGMMSGTSMDAVDAVLVDLEEQQPRLLGSCSTPIPPALREALITLAAGGSTNPIQSLGELDHHFGMLFAQTAGDLLVQTGVPASAVAAIGSHGQTLYHQPAGPAAFTLQIGDPNLIVARTGITTVADFRRRDMAVGGQGAPLVPAFHAALFGQGAGFRVVLNLGGIGNVTILPGDGTAVTGFDTGPANVLLDRWCRRHTGTDFDDRGAWAASGRVLPALLDRLLADPYFLAAAPKSTGPEYFNMDWLEAALAGDEWPVDVQATLCELTARSVSRALDGFPPSGRVGELLVCGGGAYNRELMRRLAEALPTWRVCTTAEFGVDPRWVEATAFAWLARETLAGRPGNLPSVTGAREAAVLGGIYPAGR